MSNRPVRSRHDASERLKLVPDPEEKVVVDAMSTLLAHQRYANLMSSLIQTLDDKQSIQQEEDRQEARARHEELMGKLTDLVDTNMMVSDGLKSLTDELKYCRQLSQVKADRTTGKPNSPIEHPIFGQTFHLPNISDTPVPPPKRQTEAAAIREVIHCAPKSSTKKTKTSTDKRDSGSSTWTPEKRAAHGVKMKALWEQRKADKA